MSPIVVHIQIDAERKYIPNNLIEHFRNNHENIKTYLIRIFYFQRGRNSTGLASCVQKDLSFPAA